MLEYVEIKTWMDYLPLSMEA